MLILSFSYFIYIFQVKFYWTLLKQFFLNLFLMDICFPKGGRPVSPFSFYILLAYLVLSHRVPVSECKWTSN